MRVKTYFILKPGQHFYCCSLVHRPTSSFDCLQCVKQGMASYPGPGYNNPTLRTCTGHIYRVSWLLTTTGGRNLWMNMVHGFIQRALEFPPPLSQRNLEIDYCCAFNISYLILHVTGHTYVSASFVWNVCPRLHQKQSERI